MRSLAPTTIDEAKDAAKIMATSSLVPQSYQGKPGDILVAIQMGSELNLAPMQALQNISVINGRPSVWGDALLALCRAHPQWEGMEESIAGESATCSVKRRTHSGENIETIKGTFSISDAKRAGLWGKRGPWTNYPERMLQMRARGFALRDAFADALRGVISREEAEDMPAPADITPPNPLKQFSPPVQETIDPDGVIIDTQSVTEAIEAPKEGNDTSGSANAADNADRSHIWGIVNPKDGQSFDSGEGEQGFVDRMLYWLEKKAADDKEPDFAARRHALKELKEANQKNLDMLSDDLRKKFDKEYNRLIRRLSAQDKEHSND